MTNALLIPLLFSALHLADATKPLAVDYGTELAPIPAGQFLMGSESGDADERPIRKVSVDSFQMGRTEVTIGWYLRCMADGACSPPAWWDIGYYEETSTISDNISRMKLPVTGVSWKQARDFCKWLGEGYALPTEAQWEYAAGGANGWIYPWGNESKYDRSRQRANGLAPVGSDSATSFGLQGMDDGAWEWTQDCYDPAPTDNSCKRRVSKGGSWSEHVWNLRVANKSFGLAGQGYKGLGFRVVRNAH